MAINYRKPVTHNRRHVAVAARAGMSLGEFIARGTVVVGGENSTKLYTHGMRSNNVALPAVAA